MRLLVGLALVVCGAAAVTAQVPASAQALLTRYRSEIAAVATGVRGERLEAAFQRFQLVKDALMTAPDRQRTVLESLSEEEFSRVQRTIPGALINRDEVVFVRPDPDYFLRLAAARGDAADRAFFAALKATYPQGVWPAFVKQQTDATGCTRFGTMALVAAYRRWSEFQRRFPGRYAGQAREEADAVTEQLTTSTCACGTMEDVGRELQRFLTTFPDAPVRADVGRRLRRVRAGESDIRAGCVSG